MREIIDIHQALSDPTRIRIMSLLLQRELCVCEIVSALEDPQYKISRHLTVLRNAHLVQDRRRGVFMHYSLNPDLPAEMVQALHALANVWEQIPEVQSALEKLWGDSCCK